MRVDNLYSVSTMRFNSLQVTLITWVNMPQVALQRSMDQIQNWEIKT